MLNNLVQSGIATTCKYADANPQIVQAVCKAISDSYAYLIDPKNEAEMGAFNARNLGVSPADGLALWNQYKSSFRGIVFTQTTWEAQAQFSAAQDGYVPKYSDVVIPGCAA